MAKVFECLSLALDMPLPESLDQYHTDSSFVCDLIHYPQVLAEASRINAHSDSGTITFLFQHEVGGLEVADMASTDKTSSAAVDESAKFIPVEPRRGEILLLVGYLLMRLTNKRWKNTVHRVLGPPCSTDNDKMPKDIDDLTEMAPERYSIAFFSHPASNVTIEPLASCCTEQQPALKAINVGEYFQKKKAEILS